MLQRKELIPLFTLEFYSGSCMIRQMLFDLCRDGICFIDTQTPVTMQDYPRSDWKGAFRATPPGQDLRGDARNITILDISSRGVQLDTQTKKWDFEEDKTFSFLHSPQIPEAGQA